MLNLMEGVIPEYDRKGVLRGPSGSSVTGIVPTNAYPCRADSPSQSTPEYVVIGGNGDTIYTRLMTVIDRPDLTGPDYQHNQHRVARQEEIELAISNWTSRHTAEEVIDAMNKAGVPVGRVQSVKEVIENEQVISRGAVRDVPVKEWNVKMQGTFPFLDGVDAQPTWAGPDLGYHTNQVLSEDLELTGEEINQLRMDGIIG
jgi:crotonobetainyl-CoA:carnitine CoA-transferase CaiB-like acyl-CoA transferase